MIVVLRQHQPRLQHEAPQRKPEQMPVVSEKNAHMMTDDQTTTLRQQSVWTTFMLSYLLDELPSETAVLQLML